MISLKIVDVKEFMGMLLGKDTFDCYLLEELTLIREYTLSIDGRITEGFFTEEEAGEQNLKNLRFLPYGRFRAMLFDQIKGKRTPELLKLVLAFPMEEALKCMPDVAASDVASAVSEFVLQIIYDHTGLILRTGVAYQTFVMDKSMDLAWDFYVREFLKKMEICVEE